MKIANVKKNQEIYANKKKGLLEIYDKFKLLDKSNIKIDLVDPNTSEKVSITTKGDLYASQYLTEKIPYELNIVTQSLIVINLDDKGEFVYDPLVFKGDFYRTIDEGKNSYYLDIKYEDYEKNNKNKKNVKKK